MGSKSDQLLQLTGFAVHLRSRLQIGADEIDPSKARSPSRTGGTVDPRAEGSALPAVPDGGLGEVHGGEPAREEVEVACWSEEGEAFSSEFQMGSSEMFTFLLFSFFSETENGPNANPNVYTRIVLSSQLLYAFFSRKRKKINF